MTCPDLKSRNEANGEEFDVERAYCTETGEFVEPALSSSGLSQLAFVRRVLGSVVRGCSGV